MIGRIDSTPDRRRPASGRSASLVAIAGLIALCGWSTATFAQTNAPRARIQGVTPTTGTAQDPGPANPPAIPDQLPPLDQQQPPPIPTPPANEPQTARPPVDQKVRPTDGAEADDKDKGPLPTAILPPGGAPPSDKGGSNVDPDPFFLRPDRMTPGKQRVQLTVEVQANPIMNLNKEATVKLVVFNESNVDASGLSLVYQLPESLKFVSSTPEATPVPGKPQYQWANPMLPAGGQWVVLLKVVPITTKPAEHAATVTVKTGSRANSTIQEPRLKVEATSSPGRVLKGEQVNFTIAVHNPGTGPARNVIVQAKLSSGLKSGSDDIVEQTIPEIGPGQRVELDVLTVDTIAGGEQSCTVDVRSPDVIPVIEDQRVIRTVEVTKPELAVKLEGQNFRFTGQTNEYKLTVQNKGTAPAKKVKVVAVLPQEGGKLIALPPGARFILETRKLVWSIAQIQPGEVVDLSFAYGTNTPGLYRASAEVTSADLQAIDSMTTEVSGIAVLDLQIKQTARVVDVGKNNFYDFEIKNVGTKEATKLALSGTLAKNLKVVKSFKDEKGDFVFNAAEGSFLFPAIERLGVNQSITLSIEVQATESGPGGCKVKLAHAEMAADELPVEDVISTTITGNGRPRTATAKKP
jgi:uncharacterized repeat protein (TIGR01451 family)